ncbi:hypothetical protein [Butyrivibrio sp. MC2013]|uniref:hypothetical protein n=1 Tax=Butyrivibrio sp. MC2013 TaxID=1280686 RepID=UPI0004204CB1|nr:hypothetical protein [Butyrivibrio sp. MC2013]
MNGNDIAAKDMRVRIKSAIEESSKILVGIGDEWRISDEYMSDDPIYGPAYIKAGKMADQMLMSALIYHKLRKCKDPRIEALEKLKDILKGKDYFVISSLYDSSEQVYNLFGEYSVFPFGTMAKMQAKTDSQGEITISEGSKILSEIMKDIDALLNKELSIAEIQRRIAKSGLVFNQKRADMRDTAYNENGYLTAWQRYQDFISSTMGKDLLILELGVSLDNPGVIRFPFEKMAYYNNKAYLVRINERLFQVSKEISDKALSVSDNSYSFIMEL